jgi:predicted DNA-binding transcriptional regulator YafY
MCCTSTTGEHLGKCMTTGPKQFAVIELPALTLENVRRYWGPTIVDEQNLGETVRVRFGFREGDLSHVARWLLGLGTDAVIIEPIELRGKVASLALATAQHHR